MAAVLDAGPGAVLSHHSAAALWESSGLRPRRSSRESPAERLGGARAPGDRCISRSRSAAASRHGAGRDSGHHAGAHDLRPRCDRASDTGSSADARHGLVDASARRRADGARARRPRQARATWHVARCVSSLAERGPDYIPPASGLEGRFQRRPRRVTASRRWTGRWTSAASTGSGGSTSSTAEARLIVQIDSERYHSALDRQTSRRATDQPSSRLPGSTVLRFTDFQVWYCADEVASPVRKARRAGFCARRVEVSRDGRASFGLVAGSEGLVQLGAELLGVGDGLPAGEVLADVGGGPAVDEVAALEERGERAVGAGRRG